MADNQGRRTGEGKIETHTSRPTENPPARGGSSGGGGVGGDDETRKKVEKILDKK